MIGSRRLIAAAAIAALLTGANPARADDDCDDVIRDANDAIQIATKNYQQSIETVKANPSKASATNLFCAVTGEFLGASTAFRTIVNACHPDGSQRDALASLDKSIKDIQAALDGACK